MATGTASRGLVPRSLSQGDSPPWLLGLVQQIGEARFGVEKIEELKLEDRRSWLTFTRMMAKAGGDFSKLARALEDFAAEETRANIQLAVEQGLDLIERRKAEARLANKAQKREETRFKEEQEDRQQARQERHECHQQSLKERETSRKIYRAREIFLMSGTAVCIFFSLAFIAYGVLAGKPLFFGGSAGIAVAGFARMFLRRKGGSSPSQDPLGPSSPKQLEA